MIDTIKKRLRSRGGFSLAELLMAILIVLMMTSVVTAGIPAASNAYYKVIDAANAQTLLSTTMTSLRDELSTATQITVSDDKKSVSYISSSGVMSRIKYADPPPPPEEEGSPALKDDPPALYVFSLSRLSDPGNPSNSNTYWPLVSKAAANKNLHASFRSIDLQKNDATGDRYVVIESLSVYKDGTDSTNSNPLATIPKFEIRVIT